MHGAYQRDPLYRWGYMASADICQRRYMRAVISGSICGLFERIYRVIIEAQRFERYISGV